ncbi:hypothetical protein MPLA_630021 [Mesorhizobium sp. ORS 3359]|nr:hypothetical protein MPLA_630021 [Mesorhizobium sp. ORS 3359]
MGNKTFAIVYKAVIPTQSLLYATADWAMSGAKKRRPVRVFFQRWGRGWQKPNGVSDLS